MSQTATIEFWRKCLNFQMWKKGKKKVHIFGKDFSVKKFKKKSKDIKIQMFFEKKQGFLIFF